MVIYKSAKIADKRMTRFIHDQFAKDYLEELLSQFGECQAPLLNPQ
ncbi:hypothetical protein [Hydrocoleum sp. CS-953]|nr:hypothetical protein [Hydrocoleum sp. CS-953]